MNGNYFKGKIQVCVENGQWKGLSELFYRNSFITWAVVKVFFFKHLRYLIKTFSWILFFIFSYLSWTWKNDELFEQISERPLIKEIQSSFMVFYHVLNPDMPGRLHGSLLHWNIFCNSQPFFVNLFFVWQII